MAVMVGMVLRMLVSEGTAPGAVVVMFRVEEKRNDRVNVGMKGNLWLEASARFKMGRQRKRKTRMKD